MLPEQEEMVAANNRHIPEEIVEEILLNLPAKSLFRFSSVSKSWNSMNPQSGFVNRYRISAALRGGERMIINHSCHCLCVNNAFSCPLSSTSSSQCIADTVRIICSIQSKPYLHAFCNELWCVQVENSLSFFLESFHENIQETP